MDKDLMEVGEVTVTNQCSECFVWGQFDEIFYNHDVDEPIQLCQSCYKRKHGQVTCH